jgi:hypothetical protein
MKLYRNVHSYEKLCPAHVPGLSVKGQGHTLRSLKRLVRSKTYTCIEGFQYNVAEMFTFVRLSVACKIQVPVVKVKVTHMGQS